MNNELICTPVMLPTKDETSSLLLVAGEPKLRVNKHGTYASGEGWDYQHLYLVSEERIEKGDKWLYHLREGIHKPDMGCNVSGCKEVIATTDKSLSLPLIPNSFIERWVNEQGKIDRVRLRTINGVLELKHEYRTCEDQTFAWNAEKGLVSKTPLRSEVIILPIEDKTFSREELKQALSKLWEQGDYPFTFNEWFDKHY